MQHPKMHRFAERDVHVGSSASRTMVLVEEASKVLVSRGTSTCTSDSEPGCTKPTQVPTLAIALAIMYVVQDWCIALADHA